MITIKDVEKLANLSRIEVDSSQLETVAKQIDSILNYVGQISDIEIENRDKDFDNFNSCREDVVTNESGFYSQKLLENAPQREGNYFKVKNIF